MLSLHDAMDLLPELEDIDKCEDDANGSSTVPLLSNPAVAHWQGRYLDITVQKQRVGRLLLDATSNHARVKKQRRIFVDTISPTESELGIADSCHRPL